MKNLAGEIKELQERVLKLQDRRKASEGRDEGKAFSELEDRL